MSITIQGHQFEITVPPYVAGPCELTEGEASTLNQTRLENIRNNFAGKIKTLLNGSESLTEAQLEKTQADLNAYAATYAFGVRAPGQGRRVVDPIEREMLKLAKDDISKAFFAKHGAKVDKDALAEAAEKVISLKHDDYAKRARRILREREAIGLETLESVGLS